MCAPKRVRRHDAKIFQGKKIKMKKETGLLGYNDINSIIPNPVLLLLTLNLLFFACLFASDLGIEVGNKSVDFSLQQVSSEAVFKLSDYETKTPVLLNFFATWCPSCIREIPELNRMHKEYEKKGLEIVSVNVQEDEETVADFAGKKKIIHKILLDSAGSAVKKFKVYELPTNILIDSKGIIVFRSYDLPSSEEVEKVLVKSKKESEKRKSGEKK